MEKISSSSQATKKIASILAKTLTTPIVLALYGDLGSGKTTFVQGLAKGLGITQRVLSPTFVLHRIYSWNNGRKLHHLDLYRVTNQKETESLDLKELFTDKNNLVVIEWPEKIEKLLPAKTIRINFEQIEDGVRRLVFS